MRSPVESGTITARFDQLRPLSAERPTHVHGAVDIAAPVGTPIVAPERGMLHYFAAYRPNTSRSMSELELDSQPFDFAGRPYFYDIYGGIIVLLGASGKTHLICHVFMNQLFNQAPTRVTWRYKESPKLERFPLAAWYTTNGYGRHVKEGDKIAAVGNAGYSTGPHIHWEIHSGRRWQEYGKRPDPEQYL